MMEAPVAVNVLGVLNLVFAGLGILTAAWGLFMVVAGNPFLKFTHSSPQMSAQLDAQMAMQAKVHPMTITSSILSILVAIPMIVAGIQLLKKRKNALKWSNTYAWSSIGTKFVNLILTVTIMLPAMREMSEGMMKGAHLPGSTSDIMSTFMAAGAIGGILVACAYPILTLILLNRSETKAWFAAWGK